MSPPGTAVRSAWTSPGVSAYAESLRTGDQWARPWIATGRRKTRSREAGRALARLALPEPRDESDDYAGRGNPGRPGGQPAGEARPEVAGVDELQRDPGGERNRHDIAPDEGGEHSEPTRERERERQEAREAPRLRQRDGVGERHEQRRDEGQSRAR